MRGIYPVARTVKAEKYDLGVVEVEERRVGNIYGFDGGNYAGNVYDKEALSPTIRTYQGGNQQPMIVDDTPCKSDKISQKVHCGLCSHFMDDDCNLCGCSRYDGPVETKESQIVAMRGRNPNRAEVRAKQPRNLQYTDEKDNVVLIKQATKEGYAECECGGIVDLSFPDSKTRRGRVQNKGKICPTITAESNGLCRIENQYRIRKLTPLECWRLMGFSDEDFRKAELANSNTQLYKQAGNSIVVDVLKAIFSQMLPERTQNK